MFANNYKLTYSLIMNNDLYIRPDTKEPMATIQTARGCPSQCVFCLTPEISGKKVRFRSPQNVLDEMIECYEKFNIRNFFFKAVFKLIYLTPFIS